LASPAAAAAPLASPAAAVAAPLASLAAVAVAPVGCAAEVVVASTSAAHLGVNEDATVTFAVFMPKAEAVASG
jgi:hypothetical protein